ncbi:MAG: Gfo/Idh/MocA family oxidoreductase, partial [Chloroflexi bacterium]|nr:Gfo/Idh/MocA family oxidoreductase [Chloroflexota bacterium]
MNKHYRGALVGCGYASAFQLTAWSQIEGVEIVAVCSRTREKAERRAAEYGIPAVYQDYETMLDAETLDFVDIATPPATHLPMVRSAAERKLHVLCQKPIADTLAELREMIAICDAANVLFMVNENGRFQPYYRKARLLIKDGVIGKPYYANLTARKRLSLPELRFKQPFFAQMPRLMIYEMGVHLLDTARALFGEASTVYA